MAKTRSRPSTGPSIAPKEAAKQLRYQCQKGRALVQSGPITSAQEQAWEAVIEQLLRQAFGEGSEPLNRVMDVGRYKYAFGGATPEQYEAARTDKMETRLVILDGLIELLETQAGRQEGFSSGVSMNDLDVIISWSGQMSHQVAEALCEWLPRVLPGLRPWISSDDIAKGTPWFQVLMEQLAKTRACIICITLQNVGSPWIHYEAGAIAGKRNDARVYPYLVSVEGKAVGDTPLGQFQWTVATFEDTWKLVRDLNKTLPSSHDEKVLYGNFENKWASLHKSLESIQLGNEPPPLTNTQSGRQSNLASLSEEELAALVAASKFEQATVNDVNFQLLMGEQKVRYLLDSLTRRNPNLLDVFRNGDRSIPDRYCLTHHGREVLYELDQLE